MTTKEKKPVSRAARSILRGLKEAVGYERGEGEATAVHRVAIEPPVDIAALRTELNMSQSAFAATFGVTKRALEEWEQGLRQPRGAARTLLYLIAKEPQTIARLLS
jgi:putative transcriptional regulator